MYSVCCWCFCMLTVDFDMIKVWCLFMTYTKTTWIRLLIATNHATCTSSHVYTSCVVEASYVIIPKLLVILYLHDYNIIYNSIILILQLFIVLDSCAYYHPKCKSGVWDRNSSNPVRVTVYTSLRTPLAYLAYSCHLLGTPFVIIYVYRPDWEQLNCVKPNWLCIYIIIVVKL